MEKRILMNKALSHLHTINQHKIKVTQLCFRCHLYKQGILHDLSKYSYIELKTGFHYYQGFRSPIDAEKEEKGYSLGWLHHKGRNKHHWEYWYDMKDGIWQPLEMPFNYFVEMVCDRVAACKIYQKEKYTPQSALNYYLTRNDAKYMHPKTSKDLERVLKDISLRGEAAVFHDLKLQVKQWKKTH